MDFAFSDVITIGTFFIATVLIVFINKVVFTIFPVKTDRRKLLNALTMLAFFVVMYYIGPLTRIPWVSGDDAQKAMGLLIAYFSTMLFVSSLDYFIWNGICVRGHRPGVPKILTNSLKVIIYFVVLVACGNIIYALDLDKLLAAAGLFTFLIGMAAQPTVANLFAGLAIQFGGKLKKGAYIEASGKEGIISAFTWRSTTVTGAKRYVIPNSSVSNQTITIFNDNEVEFFGGQTVSISIIENVYEALDVAKRVMYEVCTRGNSMAKIVAISDKFVTIYAGATVNSRSELMGLRSRFISSFLNRCRKQGIALISPDVVMADQSGLSKHFESPPDSALTSAPTPPSKDKTIEVFRKNDIFKDLDDSALDSIYNIAKLEHYSNGEVLCVEGEPGSSFFSIISGTACTSENHDGIRNKMRDLVESDVIGLKAFLLAEPRRITVESTFASLWVLSICRHDFQPILDEHPEVLDGLSNLLIQRETENMKKHSDLNKDAEADQDIASVLLGKIGNLFRKKK
jgi:small-conductance mechanosensitive channel/CRP-like cAMP-binding protein